MADTGSTKGFNQGGVVSHYDSTLNPEHQTDLWRTCPMLAILCNPKIATVYEENWSSYDTTDEWTLTQQTTGTAAISTAATGVLEIDSNSTTATQGVNLQRTTSAWVLAANKSLWYEARIKVVDTYDKAELFIGLANDDTTIIGTSAVSTTDHIGFSCVTDNGVLLFNCEKAGTGTTGTGTTISEATYVDLGEINIHLALGIATIKASIVALYFMHLRYDRPFYGVILATAFMFVALFIGAVMDDTHAYQDHIGEPSPAAPAAP